MNQLRKIPRARTVILAAVIAAIVTLAGCGTATPPHPAAAAVVSTAPAPPPSPPSQAQQITTWVAGSGYSDFRAVLKDLNRIKADAGAENLPGAEADGAQLAVDAQVAADNPCPVGTAAYASAMRDYSGAGINAASGNFAAFGVGMVEGSALLNQATAAINNAKN